MASELKSLGDILGLLQDNPETFLQSGGQTDSDVNTDDIDALIEQRNIARTEKDFATADKIRDQLNEMGVEIEDAGGKTSWRLK